MLLKTISRKTRRKTISTRTRDFRKLKKAGSLRRRLYYQLRKNQIGRRKEERDYHTFIQQTMRNVNFNTLSNAHTFKNWWSFCHIGRFLQEKLARSVTFCLSCLFPYDATLHTSVRCENLNSCRVRIAIRNRFSIRIHVTYLCTLFVHRWTCPTMHRCYHSNRR